MQRKNGFTLIEMLMAMGITAIIAGIGTTTYFGYRERVDMDGEGSRAVLFFREAIARARSQQKADSSTSTTWAIKIDKTSNYYELLSGGVSGVSVNRIYLPTEITFTATTSDVTAALRGGATTTVLSSPINFGFIRTGSTIREEFQIGTNGKITRTKYY